MDHGYYHGRLSSSRYSCLCYKLVKIKFKRFVNLSIKRKTINNEAAKNGP